MIKSLISGISGAILLIIAGAAQAGPVFITGHDPDFHSQPGAGHGGELLEAGINYATSGSTATFGGKFLWVESNISVPGGHLRGENGLISIGLSSGTHYDTVNAAGFAALSTAALNSYTAIAVASSFGGTLTRAELDALIARKNEIQDFVNAGGGIFASSECYPCGANLLGGATAPDLFGYLPVTVTSIPAAGPFAVTAFGASLGLTNVDMNDPTHNSFGLVGGLNVVDFDNNGNATTLAGNVFIGDGGFTPAPAPGAAAILALAVVGMASVRRKKIFRAPR